MPGRPATPGPAAPAETRRAARTTPCTGALTLTDDQFSENIADGGDGGNPSGTSPSGGTGGNGGDGGMGGSSCGNGGNATGPGSGGDGGETKPGGSGGKATGGAVASVESASESGVQLGSPDPDEVNGGEGGRGIKRFGWRSRWKRRSARTAGGQQ